MELTEFDRRTLRPQKGFNKHVTRPIDIYHGGAENPFWGKSSNQTVFPCAKGVVYDKLHSYRTLARCGKWTCEYCGDVKKRAVQSEIQLLRERHRGLPVFTVLTFRTLKSGLVRAKGKGYLSDASVKAIVRRWCARVAKELDMPKAYFKGFEPFKSGAPHVNIMWFGVRRSFTSCPILDRRSGKYDMRLTCQHCDACRMREIWTELTGAERSTHVVATGNTASYVTKYITKTVMDEFDGFFERFRRYSFSRACKRSPNLVPVYRYIGMWLRHSGLWKFGYPEKGLEAQKDYLTDYYVFTRNETKFSKYVNLEVGGFARGRAICSSPHDTLCDIVPYWSPSRIRAWGGVEETWESFSRMFGVDTMQMVINKIKYIFNKYKGVLL